ncbi:MAG: hypothetical protein KJ067_18580 [Vicinamibacteria bacterium]|nr:hypothetical protein [Vicinamibacteria bacterium]
MPFIHFDEARTAALGCVENWIAGQPPATRALLLVDLFGKLRLAVWSREALNTTLVSESLAAAGGPWWTGECLQVGELDSITRRVYDSAWDSATGSEKWRVLDRHRSRTAWFRDQAPGWQAPSEGPPVIVFYSFKGGLGRSTLLASFAIQRAQAGDRVCVLDFDLDSPGLGSMLSADSSGLTASWGVVDFLIEGSCDGANLSDYFHRCDRVSGGGEIVVFPAGRLDETYVEKLARVDFDEPSATSNRGLVELLTRVRAELAPQWILLDARTGLSEPAGELLSGLAHLHVLLGTPQEQSWLGLGRVLDRLGRARVEAREAQAELLMVQAMVPERQPAQQMATESFLAKAEAEFTERYYAEGPEGDEVDERYWDVGDMESLDAPHRPVAIPYREALSSFADIGDVKDVLTERPYAAFAERVVGRFTPGEP